MPKVNWHITPSIGENGQPLEVSSDVQEVIDFLSSEQEAFYRGDIESFLDHWHHGPETRKMLSGTHVGTRIHCGWDELLPRWHESFREFPQDFNSRELLHTDILQVQVVGDIAWVAYDQTMLEPVPGMQAPPVEHGVKIVQRINGAWKLVCHVGIAPDIGRQDVPRIELGIDGRVAQINDLAQERLQEHPGLTVSRGGLRARQRKYDRGLQAAIDHRREHLGMTLPPRWIEEHATMVPLGEDDTGHLLFCWVMAEQERVLVSFDDAFMLRSRLKDSSVSFGISPAQVKLCEFIASGSDLATAAEGLGVSINTVRTQLQRMFEKTGTHSQAALLSLLLSAQGPS